MISAKLKQMKIDCGMSNKEIADKSGVPLATVNRVMSEQGGNPNFQTVCDLVKAMGGSLDELADITTVLTPKPAALNPEQAVETPGPVQPAVSPTPVAETVPNFYEELLAEKDKTIAAKDQQIKEKELWMQRLFIVCCVLGLVLIGILVYDLLNPSVGFFTR